MARKLCQILPILRDFVESMVPRLPQAALVDRAPSSASPPMDFLDFEDNRVAEILEQVENSTLTAEEGVIELLDEEDLLQELRANADLVAFFQDHPEPVVACALVRDGEGQSGDTETLEPDKPTRRDRRGGVAAEVLT